MVSSRLGSSYVMMVAGGRQKKKALKRRSRHQIVKYKTVSSIRKKDNQQYPLQSNETYLLGR